jgi:hypothetical protein
MVQLVETNLHLSQMIIQIIANKAMEQKTAADPKPLARPDRSWCWIPILSTTFSIAELISSTISTTSQPK